jgi:hypothetical protein
MNRLGMQQGQAIFQIRNHQRETKKEAEILM